MCLCEQLAEVVRGGVVLPIGDGGCGFLEFRETMELLMDFSLETKGKGVLRNYV